MRKIYRLHEIRYLTEDTYVMRFDRNGMPFRAGQHITLGIPGNNQVREYSIYSTEQDNALEVLIKEVETGSVSRQLSKLIPGELLEVDGPFGYFTVDEKQIEHTNIFLLPQVPELLRFTAWQVHIPALNYTLLHGVRYGKEAYESFALSERTGIYSAHPRQRG